MDKMTIIKSNATNNKEVYFFDYTGMKNPGDLTQAMKDADTELLQILKENPNKKLLVLADVNGSFGDNGTIEYMTKNLTHKEAQIKIYKSASLGVTGIKKMFGKIINTFTGNPVKFFEDKDEAIKWLVED